jgi:hypothetical protein
VRAGDYAGAFAAILAGYDHAYPDGRFAGADRVLGDDVEILGAVYLAHGGGGEVRAALAQRRLHAATAASTRFILYWETDANDVDLHVTDRFGDHAWYSNKRLASGGELYADVTTGFGPECFAIRGTPKAGPYRIAVHYFSRGAMGFGMGLLQIERYDGKGHLVFDDRPYVLTSDREHVEVGEYAP